MPHRHVHAVPCLQWATQGYRPMTLLYKPLKPMVYLNLFLQEAKLPGVATSAQQLSLSVPAASTAVQPDQCHTF